MKPTNLLTSQRVRRIHHAYKLNMEISDFDEISRFFYRSTTLEILSDVEEGGEKKFFILVGGGGSARQFVDVLSTLFVIVDCSRNTMND